MSVKIKIKKEYSCRVVVAFEKVLTYESVEEQFFLFIYLRIIISLIVSITKCLSMIGS